MACMQVTSRETPGPDAGSALYRASPVTAGPPVFPLGEAAGGWAVDVSPWPVLHLSAEPSPDTTFPSEQLSHQLSLLCHLVGPPPGPQLLTAS